MPLRITGNARVGLPMRDGVLHNGLPWMAVPVLRMAFRQGIPEPQYSSPLESAPADQADPWESACIRDVQGGQPDAFNPLVARYAPRIRAYLFRMVRNREEAEDLTQEAFIKAFQALHRFDAARPFKRWLFTIATNTGLNAIRNQKRRGVHLSLPEDQVPAAEAPSSLAVDERLESALAQLSARSAQLIALHYHEGFSIAEAGTMLGISDGAAKTALCRARSELRRLMKDET